jgi:pimeloyl-ACP methyl ester carboxylesterase
LRKEFDEILTRLDEKPAEITFPHPLTNKPFELKLTREMLTNLVFNTLYVPDLVATLPLSIHVAHEAENYVPLISQAYLVNADLYDGMFYSVACTEDAPLIDVEGAAQNSESSVFGNRTSELIEVCAEWPKGQVSTEFRQPISSDVPVLMLSGEADPITPPRHAENIAQGLTNEIHLIFPDMGHGNLASRCTIDLFKDFIESASTVGLDTACTKGLQPPPFFVDFSGPRP